MSRVVRQEVWRTLGALSVACVCGVVWAGCAEPVTLQSARFNDEDAGDGGDVGEDGGGGGAGVLPEDVEPPEVALTSPQEGAQVSGERLRVEGVASDDAALASVFVRVGANVPVLASSDDGFRTWWFEGAAPVGVFEIEAVAFDAAGKASVEPARVLVERVSSAPDTGAPVVRIVAPVPVEGQRFGTVLVEGEAEDDRAVVRMEVRVNGEVVEGGRVETSDHFGRWAQQVTLAPGQANTVTAVAFDALGQQGEASVELLGRSERDRQAPQVQVTSPGEGAELDVDRLVVTGTADDNVGVREVKVRVGAPDPSSPGEWRWGAEVQATSADGFGTWSAAVEVPSGEARVEARAIDVSGLTARDGVEVVNVFEPEWGEERVLFLRERSQQAPTVRVALDREGVGELVNPELQREILLLELDPTPLLFGALNQIKSACGERWREDNPNPRHDCTLTPLGQTFVGPGGSWESSAEYALVRLLTMTPANVVVEGTSIAGLQSIADGAILGITIGGGFSQILAETLGIARTDEIVSTEAAVAALRRGVLASHPATLEDGRLPVTLYDALSDLTTLGERLGPVGDHPGVVDPSVPPFSPVFGPDFGLILEASSNLRWVDGVDLDQGKEYMATVVDTTGPTFGDVLEFDFTSPEAFDIVGLVDDPRVDLRFQAQESPVFIPSCNDDDACQGNLPTSPLGSELVWSQPPWVLERNLIDAAFERYAERRFRACYIDFLGCQAEVSVGQDGDPSGWSRFDILFNLGNPPKDQYVWELIGEVGQVALHRVPGGTLEEGEANVAFTLRDVPVGLTADGIRAAIRPYLQDQAAEIASGLLGDYARNNGALDIFYRRGVDGVPYLFFVNEDDPRPVDSYTYPAPGFFGDVRLDPSARLDRLDIPGSGDTTHRKLALVEGGVTEAYVGDEAGGVYRLRVQVASEREVVVRVARWRGER